MKFLIYNFAHRAFGKYRKKSKTYSPFWGDFTIDEAKYILKQSSGNDHCRFYVMHYMHCYNGDYRGADLVRMKWFHIKVCMFLCLELPNLSSIMFLCLVILQNAELSTSELLLAELVALQKQLARWLVDYVVEPGVKYSII